MRSPFFPPPPPEDEEMEDSAMIKGDSYGMRGALPPGQDKQVQFNHQDNGVHDQPVPRHYQRKISPPSRHQKTAKSRDNQAVAKEKIPIKMAEGKNRFYIAFFDTPGTLPVSQLLD